MHAGMTSFLRVWKSSYNSSELSVIKEGNLPWASGQSRVRSQERGARGSGKNVAEKKRVHMCASAHTARLEVRRRIKKLARTEEDLD